MTRNGILIAFVVSAVIINFTAAIQCNFKYIVDNNHTLSSLSKKGSGIKSDNNGHINVFNCEEPNDEYEEITTATGARPMGFGTRFGDEDYESVGSDCTSNKKTIQPKALNTIYNKLMDVVNNATFVQTIEIDECSQKNEPCNNGNEPPLGKKLLCRQKHVKITLKAYNDVGKIVDEQFYYPSHCICELVQKKKRST